MYTWSSDQPAPIVDHPLFILTIFYNKECCPSINKQFSIDSFLDCESHHWVFISTFTLSSDACSYYESRCVPPKNVLLPHFLVVKSWGYTVGSNNYGCIHTFTKKLVNLKVGIKCWRIIFVMKQTNCQMANKHKLFWGKLDLPLSYLIFVFYKNNDGKSSWDFVFILFLWEFLFFVKCEKK